MGPHDRRDATSLSRLQTYRFFDLMLEGAFSFGVPNREGRGQTDDPALS